MKLQYISFLICLINISCNEKKVIKEESQNNITLSCEILELNERINNKRSLIAVYKASCSEKLVIDSIKLVEVNLQSKLDSIFVVHSTTLEKATNECQNYFKLNVTQLSRNQRIFLQMVYGYKICGPRLIACGFSRDSTIEQFNKRQDIISKARINLNNYIENKLDPKLTEVFPDMKKQYKNAFYILAEKLSSSEEFNDSFRDSACALSRSDTTYNRLWADKDYSSFREIK